jgi:tetratricopeptide (TPR) repeat protein
MLHCWRVTAGGRADAKLYRDELERAAVPRPGPSAPTHHPGGADRALDLDLFVSHAGEDKGIARLLSEGLRGRGWSVWLDELELTVGDSLETRINHALRRSRFGVVILSAAFFAKPWPQREYEALATMEVIRGTKVILPVWHGVREEDIAAHSPVLAGRVGISTNEGIERVADEISRALTIATDRSPGSTETDPLIQAAPQTQAPQGVNGDTASLLALALVLRDKGDLLAAESYLRQAADAGDTRGLTLLGMLARELGRGDEAERLLRTAVERGHREALTPLGLLLQETGRLDEAEQYLRRAIEHGAE